MAEVKTARRYQERFLDGYDRHQLRQDIEKVTPRWSSALRRKYASWALGGALALGGLGVPMKMGALLQSADAHKGGGSAKTAETVEPSAPEIASDLSAAQQIANEVAGGVTDAARTVASTAVNAPAQVAQQMATDVVEAPARVVKAADTVKQAFFQKEIPFGSIIYSEAKKNDLPPELVAAVVHTESKFNPTARSHAGAVGLMQLVPRTGRWLGARDLTNPTQNIQAGAKYLRYLTDRFHGNTTQAIAAYNAGEGNVRRFGGVPPFTETRNYIKRVSSFQQDLSARVDTHLAENGSRTGL
jgi:soluble lytic murein transglycosylase-like protein